MAKIRPRTVRGLEGALAKRLFAESKVLRRALDRNKDIQQILQLDGEFADKYKEFGKSLRSCL